MYDPLADHFEVGRGGVRRDHSGRAMLLMAGTDVRAAYTAASSLSDYIQNHYAIRIWERRYLARGVGMRPDLAMLAAAETYSTGFAEEDDRENKASGRRLDQIIDRALDQARVHERADWGTAVHQLTEPGATRRGSVIPDAMRPDVEAWERETRGVDIVATELFVANDALMAAGTFDHVFDGDDDALASQIHAVTGIDVTGTLVCVDKKTGRLKGPEASVQMAVYVGGELYDGATDVRTTFEERFGKPMNLEVGILAHIPAQTGKAELLPLDLVAGREAAEHAVWVRDWQKSTLKNLHEPLDTRLLARGRVERLIAGAASIGELTELWRAYQDVWDDTLTDRAQFRVSEGRLT